MHDKPTVELEIKTGKEDGYDDGCCPSIQLPKGFAMPEDAQPGEEITVLCKICPDGKGCAHIKSVDGAPYEGGEEEHEEEEMKEVPTKEEGSSEPEQAGADASSLADRLKALRGKLQG